jgi:hypothetical protein
MIIMMKIKVNKCKINKWLVQLKNQNHVIKQSQLLNIKLSNKSLLQDHPLDQIVGDLRSGVQTRSRPTPIFEH